MTVMERFTICVIFLIHFSLSSAGSDRIKLTDLKTITLYSGRMTNGRRTSSVPQLKCVGGTAGCSAFIPKVVQCYNRGSDGYDVQWECKTDMDNDFRFGNIDVICEGYDYPDDPYVLRGSCGLEYTIDFSKGGSQKNSNNYGYNHYTSGKSTGFSDIIILIVVFIIIYAIIKTCLYRNDYSTTSDDQTFPPSDGGYFSGGFFSPRSSYTQRSSPPPPGFRTDNYSDFGADCGASTHSRNTGGGFWTGAMTGGLLGYMFGSRNADRGSTYYPRTSYRQPTNFSSGSTSSETRTASGFGGTRRR